MLFQETFVVGVMTLSVHRFIRAAHFETGSIFIIYNRILRILNVFKIDFKISVTKSLKRSQSS